MSEVVDRQPAMSAVTRLLPARRPRNPRIVLAGIVLAVLLVGGMVTTTGFATVDNAQAIIASVVITGFAAIGATVIMISGNFFSLSLNVTAAASAMIFLAALRYGVVPALVIALVIAALIQAIQGFVIGAWEANPIIVTIGAGSLQIAIATMLTHGDSVQAPSGASSDRFLSDSHLGIPFGGYLLLVAAVLMHLLLTKSRWGHALFLTGQSRRAAYAAAVPVTSTIVLGFAIAGVCVGLAGLLQASTLGTASISNLPTLTFDAVAATVVGGNAIVGGHGSILRTMLGVLVIAAVSDMVLLRGYSSGVQVLISGLLVLVFVLATGRTEKQR